MSTKPQLEKQVKELKEMVRELREQLKVHVPSPENLPNKSFCMIKHGKDYWLFDVKLNPETNEIIVVDKKKENTRDLSIVYYRANKYLVCDLMGKKRENM